MYDVLCVRHTYTEKKSICLSTVITQVDTEAETVLFSLLLSFYNSTIRLFFHVFQTAPPQFFLFFLQKLKDMLKKYLSKNGNSVIGYPLSCCSKPVRPSFLFGTQM